MAEAVVVDVLVDDSMLVLELVLGVEAGVAMVCVVVLLLLELEPPAGEGFTTVVLFSVLLPGEAAGVTVVSFCSQAAKVAAQARMQMNLIIV